MPRRCPLLDHQPPSVVIARPDVEAAHSMYVMTSPADDRTMEDDPSDDVFGTDSETRHDRRAS